MAGVNVMALPPGFGFHPTDVELVGHYLKAKILGKNYEALEVIPEIDLYKHEPWDLPDKSCIPTRDCKWHFFSANDRKYANGSRKKRATEAGYWKATGKDRNIYSSKRIVGTKKTLVFHEGRAPQGRRTDWVMHEYHLNEKECQDVSSGMHDSYVLCRISKKNGFDSESADVHPVEAKQSNCPTLEIAIKPGCELKVEESVGIIEKVEPIISSDYVDEAPTDSVEGLLSSLLDDPGAQEVFDMDNDKSERREDMLNQGKMEDMIATPNFSEDLVNLGYHEADFSIDHAGIWLADLESSIVEDFVYPNTSDSDIANKSTYKDPGTSIGSYLENPASLDSKNHSETSLTDEEKLLEEMYTAATGELFNCPTQMHQSTEDGVSLSDILYGDEWLAVSPSTSNETVSDNGTGIKIRQRNREFPPKNFAGHKFRLQVHKMESGATGEVETCKYEAPSVAVLSEHYEPLDHLDSISPSKSKDLLAAGDLPSASVELQSERNRRALRRRQTARLLSRKPSKHESEILLSGKFSGRAATDCVKSASKDLCDSGKLQPKCLEDAVYLKSIRPDSVSGPGWVSCASSVKNECSSGFVDAEQPRGRLRGFIGHLRRYLSTGLNWLFSSLCVLGTSLLLFYFLVRNVCRYVKGTSTLKL